MSRTIPHSDVRAACARRWCAPALALAVLLTGAPLAHAQPEREQAAELFRRGVAAAREEQWVAARRAFERAYELLPRPEILVNLAAAQAQTDRLVEAQRSYRELVASADVDPRFREEAERALVELDREIPRVRITIAGLPAGARVTLDDEAIASSSLDTELSVNPGPHTVVVTDGDEIVARAEFSAERARTVAVPITIAATPDDDVVEAPSPALVASGPDPTPQIVVGAILAVAGAALGVVDIASLALEGSCAEGPAGACTEVWALEEGPMIGYAVAGAASLVAGIAFLVWGATMGGSGERPASAIRLRGSDLSIAF